MIVQCYSILCVSLIIMRWRLMTLKYRGVGRSVLAVGHLLGKAEEAAVARVAADDVSLMAAHRRPHLIHLVRRHGAVSED